MIAAANDDNIRKLYGINGLSFLRNIFTLNFPKSFGLDVMHLFSNVSKAMWNLWTGNLLPEPLFDTPEDSYILTKTQQEEIGKEMVESSRNVPVSVSRTPRDISKYKNSFKAVDWFEFTTIYSCPLLYGRLPQHALISWQFYVDAVRIALKTRLSVADIEKMEQLFESFIETTEAIYYQGLQENLSICTSQLHSLLHVGLTIRALGPTFVTWQFGLERFAGKIEPLTTSKSQLNVSLYNGLEMLEQLRYVRLLYKIGSSRPVSTPPSMKELKNADGEKIGDFTGKRLERQLSPTMQTLLCHYYNCRQVSPLYNEWSRIVREVVLGTANRFTITANITQSHANRARDRGCCMFLFEDSYGVQISSFGRVLSLIEHTHDGVVHDLAMIRVFNIVEEPNAGALYYSSELPPVIISVAAIVEPIGRIQRIHNFTGPLRGRQTVANSSRIRRETRYWIARTSRLELAMQ